MNDLGRRGSWGVSDLILGTTQHTRLPWKQAANVNETRASCHGDGWGAWWGAVPYWLGSQGLWSVISRVWETLNGVYLPTTSLCPRDLEQPPMRARLHTLVEYGCRKAPRAGFFGGRVLMNHPTCSLLPPHPHLALSYILFLLPKVPS